MREKTGIQAQPFTTFNFKVVFTLDNRPLCDAAFAECDGLEMSMEINTYREGGNNLNQIHLAGPVSYGQLTLKRGMTQTFDLWDWFDRVLHDDQGLRVNGRVEMLNSSRLNGTGGAPAIDAIFELTRCIPVKLKAPGLSAKDGAVAIEELSIAYERLRIRRP